MTLSVVAAGWPAERSLVADPLLRVGEVEDRLLPVRMRNWYPAGGVVCAHTFCQIFLMPNRVPLSRNAPRETVSGAVVAMVSSATFRARYASSPAPSSHECRATPVAFIFSSFDGKQRGGGIDRASSADGRPSLSARINSIDRDRRDRPILPFRTGGGVDCVAQLWISPPFPAVPSAELKAVGAAAGSAAAGTREPRVLPTVGVCRGGQELPDGSQPGCLLPGGGPESIAVLSPPLFSCAVPAFQSSLLPRAAALEGDGTNTVRKRCGVLF